MSAPSLLAADVAACCDDERWEQIPGWPYEASTCGRGRSMTRLDADGRLRLSMALPPQADKRPGKGYLYWDLRDGERRRRVPVAVAVLEAHDKPRPGRDYEACHNDGVRTDNHLAKVRWDTRKANLADMARHREERNRTAGFDGSENRGKREEGREPSRALRPVTVTATPSRGRSDDRTPSDLGFVTCHPVWALGRYIGRYRSRRAA